MSLWALCFPRWLSRPHPRYLAAHPALPHRDPRLTAAVKASSGFLQALELSEIIPYLNFLVVYDIIFVAILHLCCLIMWWKRISDSDCGFPQSPITYHPIKEETKWSRNLAC